MLLARGKTVERAHYVLTSQARGLLYSHAFDHLCEHGTARERRRTAVGQEACGLYAPIAQAKSQAQAITADRIGLFGDCVCVRQFTRTARVRQVIFEGGGVRQRVRSLVSISGFQRVEPAPMGSSLGQARSACACW